MNEKCNTTLWLLLNELLQRSYEIEKGLGKWNFDSNEGNLLVRCCGLLMLVCTC